LFLLFCCRCHKVYTYGQPLQYIKRTIVRFISLNRRLSSSNYCAASLFFWQKSGKIPGPAGGFTNNCSGCGPALLQKPEPEPRPGAARNPKTPNNSRIHPGAARTPGKKMGRSTWLQPDSPEQFSLTLCVFVFLLPVTGIVQFSCIKPEVPIPLLDDPEVEVRWFGITVRVH